MRFRVTQDKKFLQLVDSTEIESAQLEYCLTKKVDNYFIIKKKIPTWDGDKQKDYHQSRHQVGNRHPYI